MLIYRFLGKRTKLNLMIFLLSKSQQNHSSCLPNNEATVFPSFLRHCMNFYSIGLLPWGMACNLSD